jgi:hypothetical protein
MKIERPVLDAVPTTTGKTVNGACAAQPFDIDEPITDNRQRQERAESLRSKLR